MRIYNSRYDFSIDLLENQIINLVIENSSVLADVIESICNQINGIDGDFILSEDEQILPIAKKLVFISNPFDVNCNDKKIINKLYQEISNNIQEESIDLCNKINSDVISLIDNTTVMVPYSLDFSLELDFTGLLKLYDVKIASRPESLLEKIIDYIRAMNNVCGFQIFIFLNLKQIMNSSEMEQLYEFCFYEKIYLINLEGMQTNVLFGEKSLIIDKDLCKIYV